MLLELWHVDWELRHAWESLDMQTLGTYTNLLNQDVTGLAPGSTWVLSSWDELSFGRALVAR